MKIRNSAIPANLQILLDSKQPGYVLKTGYILQLKHGLMGFFPATVGDTKRIVVTTDAELIEEVWKTLPHRSSEIVSTNFYVNEDLGVGFPVLGSARYDNEESKPQTLVTRKEFEALTTNDPFAFRWAPGLIGDDMGEDEFVRTLEAARAQTSASV